MSNDGWEPGRIQRWRAPPQVVPVEMELRDQMQKIALEFPAYGYRRITAELQHRGLAVHHKGVLRRRGEAESPLGAAVYTPARLPGPYRLAT